MKKFLLTAPNNLVLFKKGLLFQLLLVAMLFSFSTSQTLTAQCIGPYQGFESIDGSGNPPTGWSFNPGTSMTTGVAYGVGTFRTGQNGIDGGGGVVGDYIETATIATPLTFSCYLASSGFDILINDGTNGWESLLNPTIRGYYGVTAASASITSGGASGAGFPTFDLASVTFGGAATNGRSNSNVKFQIMDVDAGGGGIYMDDFAWTSRTASENVIVVSELGATTTCSPITVPAAGTGFLTFYDQGGASDDYNQGQTQTMTFAPAIGSEKVQITFQTPFAIAGGAAGAKSDITVYNGPTTASPQLLSAYSSTSTIPGVSVYASSDASGNITIKFVSRTGTPLSGFKIKVECVGCPAPTALAFAAAGGFSNTQAFLTWTGVAANYEVYYSTTNTAPTGATVPNGGTVATTSATVSGLSASTLYYFWVRSNCGAGSLSSWTGPISATTLCNPQTVTYLENFNGLLGGVLPTCTSATNASWQSNSTNGNLFCNGVGQSFFTQGVTLTAGQIYRVSYDYASNLNGFATMDVDWGNPANGVAPTAANISNALASYSPFLSSTTAVLDFTAVASGTHYLEFKLTGLSNVGAGALNIDNVKIEIETCLPPTAVVGSAPTVSSGTVSWTAPASVPGSGYQYYISTSNVAPGYGSTPNGSVASGNSVVIGSLVSNTTYYVWVRSNCGSGVSSVWSSTFATFTTTFVLTTTVNMQDGNNGPGGSCSVNFFDSGGAVSNYVDNEVFTYTFYPGTAGSKLKAVFSSFRTESGFDGLMIYNGTSAIAGNLISSGSAAGFNATTCPAGAFHGANSPGTIISTDATGALTFVYRSDFSVVFAGWAATLSCVTVPSISSFTPTDNNCAIGTTTVTITGTNFTVPPVTGVFFSGVAAASYTVVNATTITAVLPASGVTTGVISIANATATGYSTTNFSVNAGKPTTTGVTICRGGAGNLTTSFVCGGYVNSGTSLSGNLTAGTDPTAAIITSFTNSAVCGFATAVRNYTATTFQVNVTGTYTFDSSTTVPAFDSMGYIVRSPFTAGTCSANWVVGDDDGGVGTLTLLSATLTAGVTYILYTTSWGTTSGTYTGPYTWTITPPPGGQIMLPGVPAMDWYVDNITPTVLGSGNSFNPVGVAGSPLANTNTPSSTTFYGACPSNPTCRTATVYVINPRPTITFTAQPGLTACTFNDVTYTTQAGQSNYIWTVPGTLGIDYTIVSGGLGTSSNTVTLQYLTTGVKTVTINYNNASGCPAAAAKSSTATTVSASGISTTVTPSTSLICANSIQSLTATSPSANFFTWSTTAGALFTDAACTVPYIALSNFTTVYFKGTADATVTCLGTVGGVGCSAANTSVITINKAIWNGSVWSNGTGPTNAISAEFQGNFTSSVNASGTAGNLSACSVVVTSGTVLFDKGTLTSQNTVAVNAGALQFTDAAFDVALYQPTNVANGPGVYNGGNTGSIAFTRTSAQLYKYDYTYWSSPVYSQTLFNMSPASPYYLSYNNAWNYISSATVMVPARGYAVRAPSSFNISPGLALAYPAPFSGVPNNGDISIPVLGGSNEMNLLGNPYPSALAADDFIVANPNLNGALYFWTHASQSTSPYQYANTDYAVWTLAGGVGTTAQTSAAGASNNSIPNGYIASGQGFFVKGLASGNAVYTNSMRRAGNNKNFYRTTADQDLEKNRYWLNMISPEGAFKQALVGYIESATQDIDRLFDGEMVEAGNAVSLYTKVNATKLSIQGRALPFELSDTVPLMYKTTAATTYTITIPDADGLFTTQHVYLEDKVLNIIHDLTEGGYTFATEAGTFEERFVLRYTTQALGTPVFNENSIIVYKNEQGLYINSGVEPMRTVTVFDVTGRVLATQKQLNNTTTVFTTLPSTQQVLLVKIEGESGRTVTKKVVY